MTRLLLSLLIAGAIARADFDPARCQFRRGITITKPVLLVSLIVDRTLYHGSHDELGDLRIVHDQVETPYVIREIDARDDSAVSPAITHEPGARTTIVTTDIGFRGLPHDRIQLVVDPGQFYRSVTVESSRDSRKWKSIGAAFIFRMEDMGAYTVSFPEQWDQYLRIRILNRDNPPLAIRQLILSAKRRVLEFPAESTGKYWLYTDFRGRVGLPTTSLRRGHFGRNL
jgi:hypothetical protein